MILRINLIVFILSFTTFIGATSAKANCLMFGENERLSNFCLLESVEGKIVDKNTAIIVSQRLMQEGYFGGLKTPATAFNGGTGIRTLGGLSPSSVFKTELWRFIGSHSIQN